MKSFKHNNTSMLNHLFHLLSKHTFRPHQNTSWLIMSLFLHAAWHRAHPNDLPEGTIRVFYTLLSQRNAYADVRAGDRVYVCVRPVKRLGLAAHCSTERGRRLPSQVVQTFGFTLYSPSLPYIPRSLLSVAHHRWDPVCLIRSGNK